ncbi:MAG: UbiA-like polyprenyltransferase [Dehalococcoidia bacterium]|nr:UbiA-like polyprenyltransferase [Dehalococcoidia bacterium]
MESALRKTRLMMENVKFEHSIFALPFAYLGMILASKGLPSLSQFVWITVAMVGARTFAMSVNRLADWPEDTRNPRTARRPLPLGLLSPWEVAVSAVVALAVVAFAAWQLNPLALMLLPLAAVILAGYAYTKRFTWLCHFILGLADGGAPFGGWIAVTGTLSWEPLLLCLAVAFWVGGFDLIYACQDVDFDRANGLHSVPARFGIAASLTQARVWHALTILLLAGVGAMDGLRWPYWLGLAGAVGLLAYEHRLISPKDLSKLNMAFFNVNGYLAVLVFAAAALSVFLA